MRFSFTLARDDIDDAARRIRTVDGCARSLDDLDLLDTIHIDDLVDVEHRLRPVFRVGAQYIGRRIIHAASVHEHNNALVTVDAQNAVRVLDPHLAAAIAGLTYEHAGDCFQRIAELVEMTLLKRLPINDIHVAARAVVRLLRDNITKRIFQHLDNINILGRIGRSCGCFFGGFSCIHLLRMNVNPPVHCG